MSPREKRLLERQDGGRERKKERKKKGETLRRCIGVSYFPMTLEGTVGEMYQTI